MTAKPSYEELEQKVKKFEEEAYKQKLAEIMQFKHIIESTDNPIGLVDRDFTYQYVNEPYCQALNKSRNEIVGHSVPELFGRNFFETVMKHQYKRCFSGENVDYQAWFDLPGWGRRYMDARYYPFKDTDGQVTAAITNVHDITEIKRLEMDLIDSEERFRAFMDHNPATIYIKDENDRHIYANPEGLKAVGKKQDEFIGLTTRELWPPEIADRLIELDRKVMGGEVPKIIDEWRGIEKGGKRWRRDIKFPIKLESGKKLLGGIALDITEIKQTEQKLQMMQFSIDNALDRIAWIAPDGHFLYANKSACEEMGYTLEEVLSMSVSDISPNFSVERWTEHYQELKKRGSQRLETQQIDGDGKTHDIEVSTNYLKYDDREFMCSFGRDITERKKAEKDLRKALDEISVLKDRLEQENIYLREEIEINYRHDEIVGESSAIKSILSQAEKVAAQTTCVVIQGETGTGKELLARAIHKMSPRRNRQMITVNCGALPGTLIESELFGREKGAFTGAVSRERGRFEVADGSTIFLDEIGDLPIELQSKLLRVIEKGRFQRLGSSKTITVDVRIIAATNHDLKKLIQEGRFRKDLFYRLSAFPITVPPLRERKEDIPLIVWAFVKDFGERMGKKINIVSKRTMTMLQNHLWPGNVRELKNVIERAIILTSDSTLRIDQIDTADSSSMENLTLANVEKRHILKILETTKWRVHGKNGAAEVLGLHPSTLRSRMKKLGIKRED